MPNFSEKIKFVTTGHKLTYIDISQYNDHNDIGIVSIILREVSI